MTFSRPSLKVFTTASRNTDAPASSGYYAEEVRLVDYDVYREVLSAVMEP